MTHINRTLLACAALAAGLIASPAVPAEQTPTIRRSQALKQDMEIPGREAVMAYVELPPGAAEGHHTHAAELFVFVQEGEIILENEGLPTASFKAGDVIHVGSGKIHQAINNSGSTARLAAVFVAEKGKALTTPVQ
jgi:quercetin dioxygenase-like cupin family protein